ncbi:MAG: TrmH family RNA methyltransferase [Saprospiraceae bacterium]|nr:TrmH family RNA methyltransferase [Saprospiraceae bacterium]
MRKLRLEELGRIDADDYKKQAKIPVVVVLDSVRSALNVGSIFRTCDAFLVEKLILCGFTAIPPHKEITKTAIGATESVSWVHFESATDAAKLLIRDGYTLLGIEQTDASIALENFIPEVSSKYALVFGNEVNGISDDLLPMLDSAIEIRQYGTKHSLNVSVCAGIVIHKFASFHLSLYISIT